MADPIRALIIDDERPARELIDALLKDYDDVSVVGECKERVQIAQQ